MWMTPLIAGLIPLMDDAVRDNALDGGDERWCHWRTVSLTVGMVMPLTVEMVSVDGWCHWCLEW
jgi:hypothetical protein